MSSRYSMGSVPNMVRSLLVVAALVVAILLMVPRVNSISQPPVDVASSARSVAAETHWPILIPTGLPDGWKATSVRYVRSTGGLMTWHVGYVSPAGDYVAAEQTENATWEWVHAQTNRAPMTGTVTIAGTTWTEYIRDQKVQNSLVDKRGAGELTTVVTGTGTFDELRVFVEHLTPYVEAR